ncbi:MAG: toll/interleukin-1 receptor domain-containing protein, partial [Acidobacteriota bacterium]
MPKLFLSYRRSDSIDVAGRIFDQLVAHFGSESVFMDVDSIPYGVDFRAYLSDWVGRCDVLLAVIGDRWLDAQHDDASRTDAFRLGDPADFVTIEISAALRRNIPVIPVLVGRMTMPGPEKLPGALSDLAYRNAAEVRSGRDFHLHMDRLIRGLDRYFESQQRLKPAVHERLAVTNHKASERKVVPVEVEPPEVPNPTNLGFEREFLGGVPLGWFNSLGFVGGVSTEYEVSLSPREGGAAGKCVRMHRAAAHEKQFGSLMQRCPAHKFSGKRIRVTAELRTENLDAWAGIWFRIDGSSSQLFFDNMHDRPIRGNTPWTRYVIEANVPQTSDWLNYGILLVSAGTVWADN